MRFRIGDDVIATKGFQKGLVGKVMKYGGVRFGGSSYMVKFDSLDKEVPMLGTSMNSMKHIKDKIILESN